jgi:hypothetical protein
MAHLLICWGGKRFEYFHHFAPLLINQMDVRGILRKSKNIQKRRYHGKTEKMSCG